MTIRDSSVARAQAGVVTDPIPDPQVPERSRGSRQFSAKHKARILDEYDALDKAGKVALSAADVVLVADDVTYESTFLQMYEAKRRH